jgi:PAS domain S-box-containing protein
LAEVIEFVESSLTDDPFRLLVESIVDYAIYLLDPNGRVTSWNAGAERIKGFKSDEVLGKHFSTFYTEEDRKAGVPEKVLETARREGKFEGEGWRVRKDGSRFWANVVVDRINDKKGELIGFAKVHRIDPAAQLLDVDRLREGHPDELPADKVDAEVEAAIDREGNRGHRHEQRQHEREIAPAHEVDVGVVGDELQQLHCLALNMKSAGARAAEPQRDQHAGEINGGENRGDDADQKHDREAAHRP